MNDTPSQPMKRKLFTLLASLPWLSACRAGPDSYNSSDPAEDALRQRFRGLSIVLVVDAVAGIEMENVDITNDLGVSIFGRGVATVALRKRSISAVGSARVPRWVRVTWRKGAGWDNVKKIWNEGTIIGDYTIPVADRIPDAVLESLRTNPKGDLRIKFRHHPDGVYFGWDIERRPGYKPGYSVSAVHDMPGGDFQEARIFNGEVVRKGWYIDKNGQKNETDY